MKKELLLRLKITWNVIRCLFSFDFNKTDMISRRTGEIIDENSAEHIKQIKNEIVDHDKVWKARMAQNEWIICILISAILHPNSERAKLARRLIDDGIPVQHLREQERQEKGPWMPHEILSGPPLSYCTRCDKELELYPKDTKCLTVEEFDRIYGNS